MKNSIIEYLNKTESAVKKIFEAYYSYFQFHNNNSRPVFTIFTKVGTPEYKHEYDLWFAQHENNIYLFIDKDNELASQIFAMHTLCGTILQFAYWGIDKYSKNSIYPKEWSEICNKEKKAIKFYIGKEIEGLPIGWIIYAGRNQAMHYDRELRGFNRAIFNKLKYEYSSYFDKSYYNESFDLDKKKGIPLGGNILNKLGWVNYELYKADMVAMLSD
ncbi:MAG: hypothetical protein RDU14_15090 [Melioribacteraceae bacterium]|nr:hypothetical protein [Melioribacteraceae bacterium]